MKIDLNIYYLYYDILNIYGDRGNVLIIKSILDKLGIENKINYRSLNDKFESSDCDILFMGGGQDLEQVRVGKDIKATKFDDLHDYIESDGCGLYVCGSYQLLGNKYIAADGTSIDGAGILDINTEKGSGRFIGDIIVHSDYFKADLVGYENHSGRTYIGKYQPLGTVLHGYGNNGEDHTEGLIYKNTIGTYMHGCCLSKNIEITKYLIEKSIKRKYDTDYEVKIDDNLCISAKNDVFKKCDYSNNK